VEIVEDEDEWPRPGEVLDQRAHRTVAAIALVLDRHVVCARQRRQRREDVRELRAHVLVQPVECGRIEPAHVLVEGIDEDRERQVSLELRSRAEEHERPLRIRPGGELGEQAGLPDPRLPDELDRSGLIELPEYLIEQFELFGSPDEMLVTQGHFPSCRG
jgi:hypothetical protein